MRQLQAKSDPSGMQDCTCTAWIVPYNEGVDWAWFTLRQTLEAALRACHKVMFKRAYLTSIVAGHTVDSRATAVCLGSEATFPPSDDVCCQGLCAKQNCQGR
eukprot:4157645-Amphidinium_carterae.1